MISSPEYYTATMAGLYASQGYLDEAVEVYRYLLARTPDRQDLVAALSDVEGRIARGKMTSAQQEHPPEDRTGLEKDFKPLLEEWVGLLFRYRTILELKKDHEQVQQRTI